MPIRIAARIVHILAALAATLLIAGFLARTLTAEIAGDHMAILAAKAWIVWRLPALVGAMALAGGTGLFLAPRPLRGFAAVKMRRMRLAAANGMFVLIPAALWLFMQARAGSFGAGFYAVQALEIVAGTVNLALLGLNLRDGLRMRGRMRGLPRALGMTGRR